MNDAKVAEVNDRKMFGIGMPEEHEDELK